jgi:hypothetical protein
MHPRPVLRALMLGSALATAATLVVPCHADAASDCSPSDRGLIASHVQAAVEAIENGDAAQYARVLEQLMARVSPACRAAISRRSPMATRCSSTEKSVILSSYQEIMAAVWSGDLLGTLQLLEDLQDALSPSCWIALNYPQDPAVQEACSSSELTVAASSASPMIRAFKALLTSGDYSQLIEISLDLGARLSSSCQAALARSQAIPSPSGTQSYPPPAVLDHGGGTYSVPGLGACTSSGCMAF